MISLPSSRRCLIARIRAVLVWLVLIGSVTHSPVLAEGALESDTTGWERSFDGIVSVELNSMPHFLAFQECALRPVDSIVVRVRKTSSQQILRGVNLQTLEGSQLYEQFWYHDGRPLAMRREKKLSNLQIRNGEQLAIYVYSADPSLCLACASAIGNCVLRLALEISNSGAIVAAAMMPVQCLDSVADSLRRFNFAPIDASTPHSNKLLTLRLVSYDGRQERYLYHISRP